MHLLAQCCVQKRLQSNSSSLCFLSSGFKNLHHASSPLPFLLHRLEQDVASVSHWGHFFNTLPLISSLKFVPFVGGWLLWGVNMHQADTLFLVEAPAWALPALLFRLFILIVSARPWASLCSVSLWFLFPPPSHPTHLWPLFLLSFLLAVVSFQKPFDVWVMAVLSRLCTVCAYFKWAKKLIQLAQCETFCSLDSQIAYHLRRANAPCFASFCLQVYFGQEFWFSVFHCCCFFKIFVLGIHMGFICHLHTYYLVENPAAA